MAQTMKAAVLKTPGLENLEIVERPLPTPGPGQVLVRLRAASLNYRDQLTIQGGYGSLQKQADLIPLSDGAGEVAAVGGGAVRFRPGDRVVANFFQDWLAGEPTEEAFKSSLGGLIDGVACEYRLFPEHGLALTPAHLDDAEAAALPCAGLTAWSAVIGQGEVGPGDVVLVQGTGGVSLFALQFAKMAGAEVILTSSSDEKLERGRALGADHLINYKTTPDWGKAALALTGGRGVDHVVEVGGAGTLNQSLRAVRPGGRLSLIGVLAGAKSDLALPHVVMRNVRLQGVTVGSYEQFQAMLRAISVNGMKPVVDSRFALDQLKDAFAHMAAGRHFGKVCVEI